MNTDTAPHVILVRQVRHLLSLPTVCLKVMEMINQPRTTSRDLEKVLAQDPPLTAHILKMANSPFYGMCSRIDTLSRAVSVIGTRRIANLVLAVSTVKTFNKMTNGIVSIENFWLHSIYCGVIANLLANRCGRKHDESIFVAGILHDIGQLILFNKKPDETREALLRMQSDTEEHAFHHYEDQVLGFNHMQVGAELARTWRLPDKLITCIACHHHPDTAPEHRLEVSLVHIANALAGLAELHSTDLSDVPPVHPLAWELTGLDAAEVTAVIEQAQQQFTETQAALLAA